MDLPLTLIASTLLKNLGRFFVQVWDALVAVFAGLGDVVVAFGELILTPPLLPLIVWCGFWLFGVDWTRLRVVLLRGGWIAVLLVGIVMVLIWEQVSPGLNGPVLGLTELSPYVDKMMYVSGLFGVMFICGAIQLSGCCGALCATAPQESSSSEDH